MIHVLLRWSLFLCLCSVVGCATYKPVASRPEYVEDHIKNYEIGQTQTAYVGEPMVEMGVIKSVQSQSIMYKALKTVENESSILAFDYKLTLEKDKLYSVAAYDEATQTYLVHLGTDCRHLSCSDYWAEIYPDGRLHSKRITKRNEKMGTALLKPLFFENENEGDKIFEKVELNDKKESQGSFKMQLIYNGKDNKNIKVMYREFKDDFARPAFYQDLTYNLSESDVIRYKNFRIKIMAASNEEITYKVLED